MPRTSFASTAWRSERSFCCGPRFSTKREGLLWAKRSLDFAWDVGVECCVIIPTRGGNGAMEQLRAEGSFEPPRLESLEAAVEYGLQQRRGRVFADLWDIECLIRCPSCGPERARRLQAMNHLTDDPAVGRVRGMWALSRNVADIVRIPSAQGLGILTNSATRTHR